jgi:hypothetical protein
LSAVLSMGARLAVQIMSVVLPRRVAEELKRRGVDVVLLERSISARSKLTGLRMLNNLGACCC